MPWKKENTPGLGGLGGATFLTTSFLILVLGPREPFEDLEAVLELRLLRELFDETEDFDEDLEEPLE